MKHWMKKKCRHRYTINDQKEENKMAKVRVNITISEDLNSWYKDQAGEMGMAISGLMCLALAQYRDQNKAIDFMSDLPSLLEKMQTMLGGGKHE
jgi:hypothetical protein